MRQNLYHWWKNTAHDIIPRLPPTPTTELIFLPLNTPTPFRLQLIIFDHVVWRLPLQINDSKHLALEPHTYQSQQDFKCDYHTPAHLPDPAHTTTLNHITPYRDSPARKLKIKSAHQAPISCLMKGMMPETRGLNHSLHDDTIRYRFIWCNVM